ncbi:YeeE/YedE family protein [Paracoccaceae bacterium GXU_MW_L88]
MMTEFTPLLSLAGGALIGLSAALFMALFGRIAGMTGLIGALLPPYRAGVDVTFAFLIGAVLTPFLWISLGGTPISFEVPIATPMMLIGGFLVGIGTSFGAGCTSGHGVCGIARGARRSLVVTAIFLTSAIVTLFVVRHVFGGV